MLKEYIALLRAKSGLDQSLSAKQFYFSSGVTDIPWDRLVHWYGRCTLFPSYFNDILSNDESKQTTAIQTLKLNIEHQDGIIMATPFTLLFLCRLLAFDIHRKELILETLLSVANAVRFQLEFYSDQKIQYDTIKDLQSLLADEYIWPSFESDDEDEMHWEEYDYQDEHLSWLLGVVDILQTFSPLLQQFYTTKEEATAKQIQTLFG